MANLLLSLLQGSLEHRRSFSGLATMIKIVLMYYLNLHTFFNQPNADLKDIHTEALELPLKQTEKERRLVRDNKNARLLWFQEVARNPMV